MSRQPDDGRADPTEPPVSSGLPAVGSRLHAFDALRAAMMLLGLVLHSAASYTAGPLGAAWPYQDTQTSSLFDLTVFIIHIFRMPAFFVMAGFFAAFVLDRNGVKGFLAHRTRRLLLPLIASWFIVFPLAMTGFVYALGGGGSTGLDEAWTTLTSTPFANASLAHLWFIYDLFIISVIAVIVHTGLIRMSADSRRRALNQFARLLPTLGGCLGLGLITSLTLIPMDQPGLDTAAGLLPPLRILVAYSVFFAVGWMLFSRRDLVSSFSTRPWPYVGAGFLMAAVFVLIFVGQLLPNPLIAHIAACTAFGFATWFFVYAVMGLFVRHFSSPRPIGRYLSDASYWMYVTHLPMVIWMPGLLAPLTLPAVVKFAITLGTAAAVTLITYHAFVRSTFIGVFMNGRRM